MAKNMGRFSRMKGKRGERKTAEELREVFPEFSEKIRRGLQARLGHDEPDILGIPGVHVEVKTGKQPNPRAALQQAIRDAREGDRGVPVAVIRDDRKEPFAILRWSDFLVMLQTWVRREVDEDDGQTEFGSNGATICQGGGGQVLLRGPARKWRVPIPRSGKGTVISRGG